MGSGYKVVFIVYILEIRINKQLKLLAAKNMYILYCMIIVLLAFYSKNLNEWIYNWNWIWRNKLIKNII